MIINIIDRGINFQIIKYYDKVTIEFNRDVYKHNWGISGDHEYEIHTFTRIEKNNDVPG